MNKKIIIEEDAIKLVPGIIKEIGKILVVTTKSVYELFKENIDKILIINNCEIYMMEDYSVVEASNISNMLIVNYFDGILAIGGGIVNDTCKLASKYSEKLFISIPTIISNDGVCSNTAVLKFKDDRTDGLPAKSPDIIIVDLNIIKNSPKEFIKAGICDILSNYTAIYDWQLAIKNNKETQNDIAKIISLNSFSNILNFKEKLDLNSIVDIKLICEALILSGVSMEIKGNTRPCSGSEHLFNHAINKYYPNIKILHGYLVGLGAIVSSLFQGQNYDLLVSFLKKNEIDVRPSTLGITEEMFINSWINAQGTRPTRYTVLNEIKLNKEKLSEIYKKIEREGY